MPAIVDDLIDAGTQAAASADVAGIAHAEKMPKATRDAAMTSSGSNADVAMARLVAARDTDQRPRPTSSTLPVIAN